MATGGAEDVYASEETSFCDPCHVIHDVIKEPTHVCDECGHQLCDACLVHHRDTLLTRNHHVRQITKQQNMQVSGRRPNRGLSSSKTNMQSCIQISGRRTVQSGVLNTPQAGNSADVGTGMNRISLSTSTSSDSVNAYTRATLKHSVNVSRESDEYACEITGLCLLGGKLIVCDRNNCKLKLFDSSYKFLYEYKCDDEPFDICMIDNDTVAVSLWGCKLLILSVGNNGMKELNNINTGYGCCGVCCYEGNIYCVVRNKIGSERVSQVRVYTPGGQIKRRYEYLSDGNVECNVLNYITVNPQTGILYVTDWDKGVLALSTSGDVIAVMSPPQLRNPTGIAVDDYGHIYVCGGNSGNVIQMSANGEIVKKILSDNVRCKYAQVVKIYGNKMFLARRRSGIISIYELS